MEAGLEETRGTFQALDGQMRALSHAAAKIGDRLQARRAPRCAARAVRATAGRLGEGARWARATACSSGCCTKIGSSDRPAGYGKAPRSATACRRAARGARPPACLAAGRLCWEAGGRPSSSARRARACTPRVRARTRGRSARLRLGQRVCRLRLPRPCRPGPGSRCRPAARADRPRRRAERGGLPAARAAGRARDPAPARVRGRGQPAGAAGAVPG